LEHQVTTASKRTGRLAGLLDGEAPFALIGLIAMGAIFAVNLLGRTPTDTSRVENARACVQCGTVVAIRHTAHATPTTLVDVRMRDGSLRTLRGAVAGFSIGDVVEVSGDSAALRDVF
jgi:hypothetical protein